MNVSLNVLLAASLASLMAGCGGQSEPTSKPSSKPTSAAKLTLAPTLQTPAESLPPPPSLGGPPPPPGTAATAVAAQGDDKMVDAAGKALTGLQFLQQAVDFYDQSKDLLFPRKEESDPSQAPELTDLSLLVKAKVLKKLPDAPPGKKFYLDPKTHRVSLVNQ